MTETEAIQLIRNGVPDKTEFSTWADLGSGSGTFTKALAQLLGANSSILALDKENHRIISPNHQVSINFQQADFITATLPHSLDGILMANALHYVNEQDHFLQKISTHLKPGGRLIVIEYDIDHANAWVPYPIHFEKLKDLLIKSGLVKIQKIGEKDSVYNASKMYACTASISES